MFMSKTHWLFEKTRFSGYKSWSKLLVWKLTNWKKRTLSCETNHWSKYLIGLIQKRCFGVWVEGKDSEMWTLSWIIPPPNVAHPMIFQRWPYLPLFGRVTWAVANLAFFCPIFIEFAHNYEIKLGRNFCSRFHLFIFNLMNFTFKKKHLFPTLPKIIDVGHRSKWS